MPFFNDNRHCSQQKYLLFTMSHNSNQICFLFCFVALSFHFGSLQKVVSEHDVCMRGTPYIVEYRRTYWISRLFDIFKCCQNSFCLLVCLLRFVFHSLFLHSRQYTSVNYSLMYAVELFKGKKKWIWFDCKIF